MGKRGRRRNPEPGGGRSAPRSDQLLGRVREFMQERQPGKGQREQVRGLLAEADDLAYESPAEAEEIRTTVGTEVELDTDGDLPHGEVSF